MGGADQRIRQHLGSGGGGGVAAEGAQRLTTRQLIYIFDCRMKKK